MLNPLSTFQPLPVGTVVLLRKPEPSDPTFRHWIADHDQYNGKVVSLITRYVVCRLAENDKSDWYKVKELLYGASTRWFDLVMKKTASKTTLKRCADACDKLAKASMAYEAAKKEYKAALTKKDAEEGDSQPVIAELPTGGDGAWTKERRLVKVTELRVRNHELRVNFATSSWNTEEHGLIYNDSMFLRELKQYLETIGVSGDGIDYSEAGMQGHEYVSLDVDEKFIASWLAKEK